MKFNAMSSAVPLVSRRPWVLFIRPWEVEPMLALSLTLAKLATGLGGVLLAVGLSHLLAPNRSGVEVAVSAVAIAWIAAGLPLLDAGADLGLMYMAELLVHHDEVAFSADVYGTLPQASSDLAEGSRLALAKGSRTTFADAVVAFELPPMAFSAILTWVLLFLTLGVATVLLLLALVPALVGLLAAESMLRKGERLAAPWVQQRRHLFECAVAPDGIAEMESRGTPDYLRERYASLGHSVHSAQARRRTFAAIVMVVGWIPFCVAFAGVFLLLAPAATGSTLILVTILLGSAARDGSRMSGLLFRLARLGAAGTSSPLVRASSGPRGYRTNEPGLVVTGVEYKYDGALAPSLTVRGLALPTPSLVAIVGANGAGKSTFGRLLAGLGAPGTGVLTLDGREPSASIQTWSGGANICATDFMRPEWRLMKAVRIGAVARVSERQSVMDALSYAGAPTSEPQWELDRMLGVAWAGGASPSTGQWQQIALARCAFAHDAHLTILDEPTAYLFPEVARQVLATIITDARRRARDGHWTFLITHDASAALEADVVIVLHAGEIVEVGAPINLWQRDTLFRRLSGRQVPAAAANRHEDKGGGRGG